MKWTDEQQKVIDTRGKDILVSAAAGSGKTAVLVERIINRILNDDNPVDIDRLLVLTFTREAAREMRDRIRRAIEKKIEEEPRNKRLQKQKTLVSYANITTIDSFCSYIVKNNFQEVGIDPNFRVVDEAESTIFKEQALAKVFEDRYEEGRESFLNLVSTYKKKNSDAPVREYVSDIARKSEAMAWPDEWLDSVASVYDVKSLDELGRLPFVKSIFSIYKEQVRGCIDKIDMTADTIKSSEYGFLEYAEALRCDKDSLIPLLAIEDPFSFFDAMKSVTFPRLVKKDADKETHDYFNKKVRAKWKDVFSKDAKKLPSLSDGEAIIDEFKSLKPYIDELISLVRDYRNAYQEKKDEVNGLDFSDLEHAALSILVDKETKMPTNAASSFQNHYAEVMVDEYQDSNEIQDNILKAVSGDYIGKNNYFCVGDVKQSIYGFRMADPSIFMKKFEDFSTETESAVRIDLNKNFRSREEVLDITNDVFSCIMDKDMGDVTYDSDVYLYYGASYGKKEGISDRPEVWYMNPTDEELKASECDSKSEFEFKFIAQRIRGLMDGGYQVSDKDENDKPIFRPLRFSDIAILRRGVKDDNGEMTRFIDILREYGIDAVLAENSGYFTTMEIETILSFLEILDNPLKDVDLVSVLSSPIGKFTNDELVDVRTAYPNEDFFVALRRYAEENEDATKAKEFISFYESLRSKVDISIADLIREIVDKTGFMNYISSLPGGDLRRANVLKLIDEAQMSDSKSADLYTFMSYIRNRKKYKAEIGMAKLLGEEDNVVRIMTIHKSKGLEFPVVFLSGCGKSFNEMDLKGNIYIDQKFGLALKKYDSGRVRMVRNTFFSDCLSTLIKTKLRGEEERLLYVAMTRAKEKLIISGVFSGSKDADEIVEGLSYPIQGKMSFVDKFKARSYFDWMIPALTSYQSMGAEKYVLSKATIGKFVLNEASEISSEEERKKRLTIILNETSDSNLSDMLKRMEYEYKFGVSHDFKNKYSVSEIKHIEIDQNADFIDREDLVQDDMVTPISEEVRPSYVPRFISGEVDEEEFLATSYGTAMHRALEGLDMTIAYDSDKLDKAILEMEERGFLSEDEARSLKRKDLLNYLNSDVCKIVREAALKGNLLREQNFVFSEKINKLFKGLVDVPETDEEVLVQGEIDCLVVKDDGVIVIDYKTDRVNNEEELLNRYSRQLQIYGEAASRTFGREIDKLLIYSFVLNCFIEVLPL
ncbi:MAG: helicase-exonuclease AddAB subunit AddA [Lachnospiraceae bacterium]|nr:helicase-exonuclease AddAB subunit AddA [Lachnospiraceae bacterium]